MGFSGKISFIFAFLLVISSCNLFRHETGEGLYDPKVINLPEGGTQVIAGINELGFDVLRQVTDKKCTPGNNMISPFSLSTVLTMLYHGSGGQTMEEFINVLHIRGLSQDQVAQTYYSLLTELPGVDKKVTFSPANSLWIRSGFDVNQTYQTFIKQNYLADIFVRSFDNSTVNEINQWVKDKTNGKISQIVDDLDNYVTVLLNAIYFYGEWLDQFPEEQTTKMPFYTDTNNSINVDMMNGEISYMRLGYNDSLVAGELFYGHGNYSLVVLVPQNDYTLRDLVMEMNTVKWDSIMQIMGFEKEVPVYLPKFKFEFSYKELKDQLSNLGLRSVFSTDADLDGINPYLYIDKIVQKTFVEVNEKGTEAAAATSGFGMATAMPPRELKIDHPFMFAIRETTTGLILFLGTVVDPANN